MKTIKYLSMFSGIGNFETGINNYINKLTNEDEKKYGKIRAECIGYSEIDKWAKGIYQCHFPKHNGFGDAKKIKTKQIPKFDLLISGFPCQSFSICGLRKGFDDTRGTLFFELARILKEKKPRMFLFENVPGLVFHNKGSTIKEIIRILTEMGYSIEFRILNSSNFGVPQSRKRIYIVGHLRNKSRPKILFNTRISGKINKRVGKPKQIIGGSQGSRTYDISGTSVAIKSLGGGWGAKTGLYAVPCLTHNRLNKRQNGRRFKSPNENSFTLTSQDRHRVLIGCKNNEYNIRKLTPLECERLQGNVDNYTKFAIIDNEKIEVSDNQRYKVLGNAVTVPVVSWIFKQMHRKWF